MAVLVVEIRVRRCVALVVEDKLVPGHLCACQHIILFGNELGDVAGAEVGGIEGDDFPAWRVLVGVDVDFAIVHTDGIGGELHVRREAHVMRIAVFQVLDVKDVAVAVAFPHEHVSLIFAHRGLVEQEWVGVALILYVVLRLYCAELVIKDLVELVLRRLGVFGGIVGAVEETVAEPLGIGELGPGDVVGKCLTGYEVEDKDLVPVAAVARYHVGQISAVVREVELLQGHCAVVRQLVGVEDHFRLAGGEVEFAQFHFLAALEKVARLYVVHEVLVHAVQN